MRTVFIISLLLFACSVNSNKVSEEPIDSAKTLTDSLKETEDIESEKFEVFFEKFKSDSLFQINRVRFPFVSEMYDMQEDNISHEVITKSNWRNLNFNYKEEFATRQTDPYTQKIKQSVDTTKIQIRGVDNGIWIDFNFLKEKGKWILISEKDKSN